MAGLDDRKTLFQPKWLYDFMVLYMNGISLNGIRHRIQNFRYDFS